MSTEKRSYELKERARRQEQTRRRIVEATVALHQEYGPAATSVAEIARRAGVSRLTVYTHFPDDGDLFAACQSQFFTENPLPDLSPALSCEDPRERVHEVLTATYRAYRRQQPMTSKVLRDRKAVPALDALLERTLDARQSALADTLASGFAAGHRPNKHARALIALALDFFTWQRLTQEGLDDADAADLMSGLIARATAHNP